FMGTGKSTIGKLLAKKLNKTFIEIDKLIEDQAGKPIFKIFEKNGEIEFRKLEIEATKKVANKNNVVISCGGGIVLNKINIDRLKKNAIIILLTASPQTILKRTSNDSKRPLLNTLDRKNQIINLLDIRGPLYKSAADFVIDTTALSVDEAVNKIIQSFSKEK
ncbi:MAG: shikimate kinase, partial [Candidatus Hermodarchaeota archaeon]